MLNAKEFFLGDWYVPFFERKTMILFELKFKSKPLDDWVFSAQGSWAFDFQMSGKHGGKDEKITAVVVSNLLNVILASPNVRVVPHFPFKFIGSVDNICLVYFEVFELCDEPDNAMIEAV